MQIASVATSIEGKPAMLSIVTDVSAIEQACRELAESEERYRRLVDHSPDGIAVIAAGGIVYANDTLLRALGAERPEDVVGQSQYRFVHPDYHDPVKRARQRILRYGEPQAALPVVLVRLDGSTFETTVSSDLVHWAGEPATQAIMRDLAQPGA